MPVTQSLGHREILSLALRSAKCLARLVRFSCDPNVRDNDLTALRIASRGVVTVSINVCGSIKTTSACGARTWTGNTYARCVTSMCPNIHWKHSLSWFPT